MSVVMAMPVVLTRTDTSGQSHGGHEQPDQGEELHPHGSALNGSHTLEAAANTGGIPANDDVLPTVDAAPSVHASTGVHALPDGVPDNAVHTDPSQPAEWHS